MQTSTALFLGIGGSDDAPSTACSEAETALVERLKSLEEANERLEAALIKSHEKRQNCRDSSEARRLRTSLHEKEKEIARLNAELALAGAAGGSSQDSSPSPELGNMRREMKEKDSSIASLKERVSQLEALQRLAQDTAVRSEAQLDGVHKALVEAQEGKAREGREKSEARDMVAALNDRVSELTLAEQCAKAEAEATRAEMERLVAKHQEEIEACERRQSQLRESLRLVQASAERRPDGEKKEPGTHGTNDGQEMQELVLGEDLIDQFSAKKGRMLSQALEDAELALAVMQSKLIAAEAAQRDAERQKISSLEEAAEERAMLLQQVRSAKEDGAVRMKSLEETIQRMSNRSDLHLEVSRLSGENCTLRRSEARLKSEIAFAEERIEDLKELMEDFRVRMAAYEAQESEREVRKLGGGQSEDSVVGASGMPEELVSSLEVAEVEQKHHQQLISRLVERAEKAEVEAGQLRADLQSTKQLANARAAAGGAATAAVMSAAHAVEERRSDLQREILMREAELHTLRAQHETSTAEIANLRHELLEASREVSSAQSRLADAERMVHDKIEAAARRHIQTSSSTSKEVVATNRRAAESDRNAEAAVAAKKEAEREARDANLELSKLKVELEVLQQQSKRDVAKANGAADSAAAESCSAKQDFQRLECEAEELRVRVSVLLETIETLQAGEPGEREQRIVSLTCQLTASQSKEGLTEARMRRWEAEVSAQEVRILELEKEVERLNSETPQWQASVAAKQAALEMMEKEMSALRSELKSQSQEICSVSRRLDEATVDLEKSEATADSLRAGMRQASNRHFEQLNRERTAAACALRAAKSEGLMQRLAKDGDSGLEAVIHSLASKMGEAVALVKRHCFAEARKDQSGEVCAGDQCWPIEVMQHFRDAAIDASKRLYRAECDARIFQAEAASGRSKMRGLESALEQRTLDWEIAEAMKQNIVLQSDRQNDLKRDHMRDRLGLQEHQLQALSKQVEKLTVTLIEERTHRKAADAQLQKQKDEAGSLQRSLLSAQGEIKELQELVASNLLLASGSPHASDARSVEDAISMRDRDVVSYFEAELSRVLLSADPKEKLMALTREVCALKLSESRLLASLAAAERKGDGAGMHCGKVRAALGAAEAKIAELQDREGHGDDGAQRDLADSHAQLAAKSHEIFRQRQELVQKTQALASKELEVQALEAERSEWQATLKRAQDGAEASLQLLREELSGRHEDEKRQILEEMEDLRSKNKMIAETCKQGMLQM